MKKSASLLILFTFGLMAADFWQKPYTEWSDKDAQKMLNNSPWAKSTGIEMDFGGGGIPPGPGFGGGGGGRGGGPQGGAAAGGPSGPTFQVVARWESALPVRQAAVRLKFGAEADKNEEARKFLAAEGQDYEIVLAGPSFAFGMGAPDALKSALAEVTFLSSPRTGAIKTTSIEVSKGPRDTEVLLVFPRSMPFTAEDKEVQLSTRLGKSKVQYKFKPKDMTFNGKLEM